MSCAREIGPDKTTDYGQIILNNLPVDDPHIVGHDPNMTNSVHPGVYIWFDLEFTDLDPEKAHILQVAVLATDVNLQLLQPGDKGLNLLLKLDANAFVSEWVEQNLSELLKTCRSDQALDPHLAEARILEYLDQVAGPMPKEMDDRPVLAGNSVHCDWRLAGIHYPAFINRLHYRVLDVSSIKLQWEGWFKQPEFDKDNAALVQEHLPFDDLNIEGQPHDAQYDILASIAELHFYRGACKTLAIVGDQES